MSPEKIWNRSSCWSFEQVAELNTLMSKAVTDAVEFFDRASADLGLTAEERQAGTAEVASQVSSQIADKIESLKTYQN
jgi:hypothetical protein